MLIHNARPVPLNKVGNISDEYRYTTAYAAVIANLPANAAINVHQVPVNKIHKTVHKTVLFLVNLVLNCLFSYYILFREFVDIDLIINKAKFEIITQSGFNNR